MNFATWGTFSAKFAPVGALFHEFCPTLGTFLQYVHQLGHCSRKMCPSWDSFSVKCALAWALLCYLRGQPWPGTGPWPPSPRPCIRLWHVNSENPVFKLKCICTSVIDVSLFYKKYNKVYWKKVTSFISDQIKVVNISGKLKSSRRQAAHLHFDFPVEHIGKSGIDLYIPLMGKRTKFTKYWYSTHSSVFSFTVTIKQRFYEPLITCIYIAFW